MGKGTPHPTASDNSSMSAPSRGKGSGQAERFTRSSPRDEKFLQTVLNDDVTLSDLTSLIHFSSAAIGLISFSAPIPCDVDEWSFTDALYSTPSKCLQANIRFARARSQNSPDELLSKDLKTLFPESLGFRAMFQLWHNHHLSRDGFEWHTTDGNGRQRTLQVACYGHIVENGLHRLWIITRDVTKKAPSNRATHNSEHQLKTLLDQPGVLFLRMYADGTLSWSTEHTRKALRIEHHEAQTVDTILMPRCHPEDRETLNDLTFQRHLRSTTPIRTFLRLVTETRGLRRYSLHQVAHHTLSHINFYDIVAVEQPTEEDSQPSSFLLSGLAHDANNHLLIASAHIQKAEQTLDPNHPALASLRAALSAISQTSAIHTQVRQLEDGITPRPVDVDVGELFRELISEWKSIAPAGMRLTTLVEPATIYARIDPTHFRQALTNLILNARDAMKDHCVITLSATLKGKEPFQRCPIRGNEVVCVSVSDNGPGIELTLLERIFTPFVSTKSSAAPRGLGLAMVKTLIERNNGQVSATSMQGIGTTFTLCLPAGSVAHSAKVEESPPSPQAFRPLAVLVADDDAQVREIVQGALAARGHTATICEDRPSLLRALTTAHRPFDAIILDDGMPGSSGPDFVRAMSELQAEIPIIVVSGDPSAALRVEAWGARATFLAKPFTFEQLYSKLESNCEHEKDGAPIVALRGRRGGNP